MHFCRGGWEATCQNILEAFILVLEVEGRHDVAIATFYKVSVRLIGGGLNLTREAV